METTTDPVLVAIREEANAKVSSDASTKLQIPSDSEAFRMLSSPFQLRVL